MNPWNIVDTYLESLGKLLGIPREHLCLKRGGVLITNKTPWLTQPNKDKRIHNFLAERDDLGKYRGQITTFALVQLPGCCGVCVSTGAYVYEAYRKKGVNILTNKLRQDLAREAGYTVLLCTDIDSNTPERYTLKTCGWHDILQFTNRRTGNVVNISVKLL